MCKPRFLASEFIMISFSVCLFFENERKLGENRFTWSFSPEEPILLDVPRNKPLKYTLYLL